MSLKTLNFNIYIQRTLKEMYPQLGLSGTALAAMNNQVKFIIEQIMLGVNHIMTRSNKKTIGAGEIHSAVRLLMPDEIAKQVAHEGYKAATIYRSKKFDRKEEKKTGNKTNVMSRSLMANLIFPVTRVQNLMMSLSVVSRKTDIAAVFLAAVCEYMTTDILDLAGIRAMEDKRVRITPKHITLSIKSDPELNKLYSRAVFAGGVGAPRILPQSISSRSKKRRDIKRAKKRS